MSSSTSQNSGNWSSLPHTFKLFHRLQQYMAHMQEGAYLLIVDAQHQTLSRFVKITPDRSALHILHRGVVEAVVAFEEVTDVVPRDSTIEMVVLGDVSVKLLVPEERLWQVWYHGLAFLAGEKEWFRSIRESLPPSPNVPKYALASSSRDWNHHELSYDDDEREGTSSLDEDEQSRSGQEHQESRVVELLRAELASRDETIQGLLRVIRVLSQPQHSSSTSSPSSPI
jgi:hypothetical protein